MATSKGGTIENKKEMELKKTLEQSYYLNDEYSREKGLKKPQNSHGCREFINFKSTSKGGS